MSVSHYSRHYTIESSIPVHKCKYIEHGGNIRVIMPRGFLQILQGLLAKGHSNLIPGIDWYFTSSIVFCIPALAGVLDDQIVEGA